MPNMVLWERMAFGILKKYSNFFRLKLEYKKKYLMPKHFDIFQKNKNYVIFKLAL